MSLDPNEVWESVSRELWLTCEADGTIVAADRRAARILGAAPSMSLCSLAVAGTEQKAQALLDKARREDVMSWEVPLVAFSAPATVSISTRRDPSGKILLHGLVLPDGFGQTVTQLNDALGEVTDLNREISRQKKELVSKNEQLSRAYSELEESNKGVLNLHAEIADKADTLRRTNEVKSRVVANVSHEFRTPLHTILGLSRLLLDASDGPLTEEQQKQIRFIRTSAEELYELVNDMLDLSKAESGKAMLRPERFGAADLFAAMRGMLRPLVSSDSRVNLVFEPPPAELTLDTDQGKVAQIIRNLVSNALKFTEHGEVRVSAAHDGGLAIFRVKDTGIGIAPENFGRIFEEFGQIDSPLQGKVKGTGLGLPLSKKLAEFLGGSLTVESKLGAGSTFTLVVPCQHPEVREMEKLTTRPLDPGRAPVLVVEDDRKTIFIYEKYLAMAGFQVVPARSVEDARRLLETVRPAAIVLDIMLEGESTWNFLSQVKSEPATRDIPVLVVTVTSKEQKARALGADEFWLKPLDKDRLLRKLRSITKHGTPAKVLVIDDDEKARYLLHKLLEDSPYEYFEAPTGPSGIALARDRLPDVILLDFLLRDMTAFDVLDELKGDPRTRAIPVIIVTSHVLDAEARERLTAQTEAILSKDSLSRELAINRIKDALGKVGIGAISANGHGASDGDHV
jgi:signal transduction histidine kinase/DNA-binding response OmpR family regulator